MKELVVAAVQMASAPGQMKQNAATTRQWLKQAQAAGAQLAFFPECSLTGYSTSLASEVAIKANDEAIVQLEQHASDLGIALGYGFVERDEKFTLPYITYVVVFGQQRLVYRKAHLGASEQAYFTQGDQLPVVDIAGVRVGVQLCWEGHIPDIASTLRAKGAELLLAPHASNLGGPRRIESWGRYLPARAQDNGIYVIACNALRPEGPEVTSSPERPSNGGGLIAYAPDGKLIDSFDGTSEHMLAVHIGGLLPREAKQSGMTNISYYDRRRPELYL